MPASSHNPKPHFSRTFKKFTSQNCVGTSAVTIKNETETNCEPEVDKVSKSKLGIAAEQPGTSAIDPLKRQEFFGQTRIIVLL